MPDLNAHRLEGVYPESVYIDHETGWHWLRADWLMRQAMWHPDHAMAWDAQSGVIQAICPRAEMPSHLAQNGPKPESTLEKPCTFLTPGFINTHTHLALGGPQDTPNINAEKTTFPDWLLSVALAMRQTTRPPVVSRVQESLRAMVASGVTCVNDIASLEETPDVLSTLDQAGMRGVVSVEFFHPFHPVQPSLLDDLKNKLTRLRGTWQGHDRLQIGLSPHAPYNVHPQAWRWLREAFPDCLLHAHVAESAAEMTWLQGAQNPFQRLHQALLGKTFVLPDTECSLKTPDGLEHWLVDRELLSDRTVLAHASFITAQGAKTLQNRLKQAKIPVSLGIAHCPRSNLALHGHTLDVQGWQAAGVNFPIGLGTDSALSAPDLDLRSEARAAMALHGWSAQRALQALTLDGARVLGLEKQIGDLAVGFSADGVLWQSCSAQTVSPAARVLAPETQVLASFVAGRPIFPRRV